VRTLKQNTIYFLVLILSAAFLFLGNRFAVGDFAEEVFDDYDETYRGVVLDIYSRNDLPGWGGTESGGTEIIFDVRVTHGVRSGDVIRAQQEVLTFFMVNEREVSVGDRVMIFYADWSGIYHFAGYQRINYVIILGIAFLVLVLLFARKKGLNAVVALGFTCMAVIWVFIPAILSGRNIYVTAIIVCVYAVISTLLIVIGANKKSFAAIIGCLGGVFMAAIVMFAMDGLLQLTGALDSDTEMLLHLRNPVDLRAIVFAGVVIGAVGAIMDVAMSISSSLWELKEAGGVSDFASIVKSGINIGKDILGTMLNTLILAYLGSSLSLLLLITAHNPVLLMLFNTELVIVEILRALVGSFGMLFAIPLTAVICGWLYTKEADENENKI